MVEVSPFAGCAEVMPEHAAAVVVPVLGLATVSVTAWPGAEAALIDAVQTRFGLTLPENGRWTEHDGLLAAWAGPRHWWLQRQAREHPMTELTPLAAHAGLIDISHGRAVLRLTGPDSRNILASLLPLDLHPRGFAPGRVASTLAAHMTVQVRQIDVSPTYDLACSRSFAGSLWRALELAGAGRLRMRLS